MEDKEIETLDEEVKETKEVSPKKKGNGGLVVVIVILLLICGGLGAFVFVNKDKLFEKDAKTEEKEQKETKKEEKNVTFADSELEEYVNYIGSVSIGPDKSIYDTKSVDASKLSAREKIEYIGVNLYNKDEIVELNTAKTGIKESDVKELVEKVYGPGTYERTTFNLGCGDYVFDESAGNKYVTIGGCGGASGQIVVPAIVDYKATEKKLEITTAYVFADGDKLYKDIESKEYLEDVNNVSGDDFRNYLKNYAKTNKDKLNHIVYTFESKDGRNYYFTGFTNSK